MHLTSKKEEKKILQDAPAWSQSNLNDKRNIPRLLSQEIVLV